MFLCLSSKVSYTVVAFLLFEFGKLPRNGLISVRTVFYHGHKLDLTYFNYLQVIREYNQYTIEIFALDVLNVVTMKCYVVAL